MRVINDRDEKTESVQPDFFAIAAHSLFSALGVASVLLGPLPLIANYARLTEPWPKVVALVGAVLALVLFQNPAGSETMRVVIVFVYGLFVADCVWKGTPLFRLLVMSFLVSIGLGLGSLVVTAQMHRTGIQAYWVDSVNWYLAQLEDARKVVGVSADLFDIDKWRPYLIYEGPFRYVSTMILSLWLSTGVASHFGWLPKDHPYSPSNLRKIRFPIWFTAVFILSFLAGLFIPGEKPGYFADGALSIVASVMFVAGTIAISDFLDLRKVPRGQRAVLYSFAIILAFPIVLLVGAFAPWFKRRNKQLEGVQ